mmetsp:Transcript_36607/g.71997  ORF Transcript_36607/g.71997 Transcript_36607/m.71997 type:complete len:85 (+) Transcript_36607:156-410(+)
MLRNAVRMQLLPSSVQACPRMITVIVLMIALFIQVIADATKLSIAVITEKMVISVLPLPPRKHNSDFFRFLQISRRPKLRKTYH